MRTILLALFTTILLVACAKSKEEMMVVSGSIDGLKKGTLYLQKIEDSALVTLDSLQLRGSGDFTFEYDLESPEVFYLYLKKADNNDINDRITFFGEKGSIAINTTWNGFDSDVSLTGSQTHQKYLEFQEILTGFNKKDIELVQLSNTLDSTKLDSLQELADDNLRRRYVYIINFALNNPNSPVSPYVVLNHALDANPKYLDSVSKKMSDEVANTKYGKMLKEYTEGLQQN